MRGSSGVARTAVLLGGVSAAALLVGSLFGPTGFALGVLAAAAVQVCGWVAGDTVALRTMRAYPVSEAQQPAMYRSVRELCTRLRQPMPRLYVSPTAAPNAFATGRSRRRSAICCTEGLLAELDDAELTAVLGRVLTHVRRGDMQVATAAAALATALMFPAQLAWLLSGGEDGRRGGATTMLLGLLTLVVGAPAGAIVRLAVTRSQERDADAAAAALAGGPLALARALRTLDAAVRRSPLRAEPGLRAVAALMVVEPFRPDRLGRLFRTHPLTADRVAHLEALAGYRR